MEDGLDGLTIEGLTRRLGGRTVVSDVSLRVRPGQVTCLLGPSGCGKSTTLRLIAGVDRPDAGRVLADGEVLSDETRHVRPENRRIGLMFQDFALFPHMTVAENVAFGLSGTASEKGHRVTGLLERVRLSGLGQAYP
ncbi:MAG: ATP-binding cassette domain-containing protein, partial [Boseongicola sp.]|nr:ATP-binding cassette domain-containing protein [Boseongicola sp.]